MLQPAAVSSAAIRFISTLTWQRPRKSAPTSWCDVGGGGLIVRTWSGGGAQAPCFKISCSHLGITLQFVCGLCPEHKTVASSPGSINSAAVWMNLMPQTLHATFSALPRDDLSVLGHISHEL